MKTILIIAAHPDDEILGVGATVAKHVAAGDEAYALILGEGQTSRYATREDASAKDVEKLHKDTMLAAEKVGYQQVYFENFADNRFDSVDLLDIVKVVEQYIDKLRPEVIYTHHAGDLNIDHQLTYRAVVTGTRPVNDCSVKEIYAFETLSSTEWNFSSEGDAFNPNVFIDVKDFFEKKIKAMKCYHSELCKFPHPRSIQGMKIQAQRWGSVVGKEYVEAFRLIRKID